MLGMVWNNTLSSDEHVSCAVMGEIGQNIQFMAYALGLGSVINADLPGWSLSEIGLPSNEEPRIIVPLGHPNIPYRFLYLPMQISVLPRIPFSTLSESLADRVLLQPSVETLITNVLSEDLMENKKVIA